VTPLRTLGQAWEEGSRQLAAANNPNARRDSQLLLLHILGTGRSWLLSHAEEPLNEGQLSGYRRLIERRRVGEPIQYIIGEREFFGLRFAVTPAVLIPRPETEHLVEAALERIPIDKPSRVADVGAGSGAIAVAIAVARPLAVITAIDISPMALKVAQANAEANGVADRITFVEVDLLEGIAGNSFDLVVSNPPYIADVERETLDAEVRDYEPATALFAGSTGLEIYERLIPQAAKALRPAGWLLMEIGVGQQLQLRQLLKEWTHVGSISDLREIPRVVLARLP
jgi:release factor glutamine methyltransferase